MGAGSYTAGDWAKLRDSKKLATSTTNEIFVKNCMNPKFDPKFIDKREARDSEEHPFSTPIIIGVDVTGSMGYLSTQIIKESLNELMQKLYASNFVKDPQIMFAAIGDVIDQAPLQVTQFESDIRIAEQLLELWLENKGGDWEEDYELLWYFAAKHTDIDSFNLRNKKGFCFSIGDAPCHKNLLQSNVEKIFSDKDARHYSSAELADMALEKYEVYHIVIGDRPLTFPSIIPGRVLVIAKQDINYLPEIIITVMQLANGMDKEKVLAQWGELARKVVEQSISLLNIDNGKEIVF